MSRSSRDPKGSSSRKEGLSAFGMDEKEETERAGNHHSATTAATDAWVPREYAVPIRDASGSENRVGGSSIHTPLTASVSRRSRTGAGTSTAASASGTGAAGTAQRQAWEHADSTIDHTASHAHSATSAPAPATDNPTPKASFPDQIAASALGATLELLKIAGGVTLSTTGKLVAPPLHVTRTLILPTLWHACVDYMASVTPTRAKGWLKIISSSFSHFFSVLRGTARGNAFRQRVVRVGGDLLDCISSDNARQVLMDSMGCTVKLAEALHTPEFKALLEQLSVLGCRLVDTAASGRNKQLIHDMSAMIYSGCELLADPSTTLALAEVTAYLCHALEMEDAAMHQEEQEAAQQAARRHERDAYQRATYTDPTMLQDPDVTVEQVILSSLGVPRATSTENGDGGTSCSIPSNVVVDGDTRSDVDWEQTSLRQQVDDRKSQEGDDEEAHDDEEDFHQRARNSINVSLLREKITERAATIERQGIDPIQTHPSTTPERATPPTGGTSRPPTPGPLSNVQPATWERDDLDLEDICVVSTVLDDEDVKPPRRRQELQLDSASVADHVDAPVVPPEPATGTGGGGSGDDAAWPTLANGLPLQNESPVNHFYRVLDEVLARKRGEAVDSALTGSSKETFLKLPGGGSKRHAREGGAASVRRKDGGPDTIKRRLAAFRSEITNEWKNDRGQQMALGRSLVQEHGLFVYLTLCVLLCFVLVWLLFGCYGIYVYLYPSVKTTIETAKSALGHAGFPAGASGASQEIVIRIIREVVHVDNAGSIVSRAADSTILSKDGIDSISKCVAEAL